MSGAPAAPKSLQHGLRVGAALLPNLLLVAEIGGKVAVGMLLVSSAKYSPAHSAHPTASCYLPVK